MIGKVEIRNDAAQCDEIAKLARDYLENPGLGGIQAIETRILKATEQSQWGEVSKWHRVRLRLQRFQQERVIAAQLLSPRESPPPLSPVSLALAMRVPPPNRRPSAQ